MGAPEAMECHKQDMCPKIGMEKIAAPSEALVDYIQTVTGNHQVVWNPTTPNTKEVMNGGSADGFNLETTNAGSNDLTDSVDNSNDGTSRTQDIEYSRAGAKNHWYGDSTYLCKEK